MLSFSARPQKALAYEFSESFFDNADWACSISPQWHRHRYTRLSLEALLPVTNPLSRVFAHYYYYNDDA